MGILLLAIVAGLCAGGIALYNGVSILQALMLYMATGWAVIAAWVVAALIQWHPKMPFRAKWTPIAREDDNRCA